MHIQAHQKSKHDSTFSKPLKIALYILRRRDATEMLEMRYTATKNKTKAYIISNMKYANIQPERFQDREK